MKVCSIGQQKLHHLGILVCAGPHQTCEPLQQHNMMQEQQIAIVRVPIKPVEPFRAVTQAVQECKHNASLLAHQTQETIMILP